MNLIRISESDDWIVDYDRERGMYRVSYFEDGHFVDEHWFDDYNKTNEIYIVYGHMKRTDYTWVENIFDNEEQAYAFAKYCNITKRDSSNYYYKSIDTWVCCKVDYVKKLNSLS